MLTKRDNVAELQSLINRLNAVTKELERYHKSGFGFERVTQDFKAFVLSIVKDLLSHIEKHDYLSQTVVGELELSVRTHNSLQNLGIKTVIELIEYSPEELLQSGFFGRKSLAEIKEILLDEFGVSLSETPSTVTTKSVVTLGLPSRVIDTFRHKGITTIGDLLHCSEVDLLKMPYVGRKAFTEIKAALSRRGLKLKEA